MPGSTLLSHFRPILDLALRLSGAQRRILLGLAGALLLVGLVLPQSGPSLVALTAAAALILLVAGAAALRAVAQHLRHREIGLIGQVLASVDTACLLVNLQDHAVIWANRRAQEHLDRAPTPRIGAVFDGLCADPDGLVARLHARACAEGTVAHPLPAGPRVHHHMVTQVTADWVLWRIDMQEARDPRDALPFALAQFAPDGSLSYLSPQLQAAIDNAGISPAGLRDRLRSDPESLFDALPDRIPGNMSVLHLPPAQEHEGDSYLVLPPAIASQHAVALADSDMAAVETMPVAIARLRPDGRLTYVNREARRLLRLGSSEPPPLSAILEGLGRPVLEWLADVASGRLTRATEVLRLHSDTEETYLRVTLARPIQGMDAEVIAAISDVTELKSLEAKFTQSQKMQAIGQLAGGVAHDFNNLLTAISGHCDLLLLRHDRSDLDYPDLMQIQQNTNRAAALVRQLLALSRQQTLKFVTLDLQETMADVIHLLNRLVGEKITLTLRHDERVAPIRTDKRQFEQVLMNLVVNARDALPMGGEIRIETEAISVPQGFLRDGVHLPAGEYTVIRIRDDGTGIPQPLLGKVFDPFFTTKRPGEGTGLGLSTVYGIVKQSGGYIFVESEEGVGTTFTLYFTAQAGPAQQPAERSRRKGLPPAALKVRRALVLLVEDEAPVRSFAARALELQGHRVIEADCGEAALEILSNPDIRPDFFVTDVIMPGLDGPSWIELIRDRFPETPVLFMSGYAEDSRVAAQARISNASFIGKPFSLAEFTETVNNQIQRRSEAA
ncbi:MAG: response regulator [Natronohydrobacter sp.]|nr:response regulator [Natronohydrobacter sp.]